LKELSTAKISGGGPSDKKKKEDAFPANRCIFLLAQNARISCLMVWVAI
jgi:hypothetical protein